MPKNIYNNKKLYYLKKCSPDIENNEEFTIFGNQIPYEIQYYEKDVEDVEKFENELQYYQQDVEKLEKELQYYEEELEKYYQEEEQPETAESIQTNLNNMYEMNTIQKLYNKNIKTIENVYQPKYANNENASGFGDFIRGSYFLLQFCDKYGFHPKMTFNHLCSSFLKNSNNYYTMTQKNKGVFDSIVRLNYNNLAEPTYDSKNYVIMFNRDNINCDNKFIDYLCNLNVYNNTLFINVMIFPYNNTICENHKEIIRRLIEPTDEMVEYTDTTISTIGLTKKKYMVFHVRCGDEYLIRSVKNSANFETNYLKTIVKDIEKIIKKNSAKDILLISDSCVFKTRVQKLFPNIKIVNKKISHMGEGEILDIVNVKNTMLDFYLLSNANLIYAYTGHKHGTGFSYWCAKTYDIPYKSKFVPFD